MIKAVPMLTSRKPFLFLIGSLLLLAILTGCAPEVGPEDDPPAATEAFTPEPTRTATLAPELTATPTEPVGLQIEPDDLAERVVRFAHPWVGEPAQTLEDLARDFSLTNPWQIWVEVYAHGGETALLQALQSDRAAGEEMPDLIAAVPYLVADVEGEDAVVDLRPYFDDPTWGFEPDSQADIPEVYLRPFIRADRITALPLAPQATVLFYNRTWGQELGFSSPPADLETFRRQICDATFANWQNETRQNGSGGWLINLDPAVLASWYYAFEGVLPEEGLPSFNNAFGQAAFGYLWDLRSQGCSWFGLQPEPYPYFGNRLALVYAGGLDLVPIQAQWMEALGSEDEWEVLGFPGPAGETMLVDGPGLTLIADTPENELAAWLFAKFLLEPESQARLVRSLFSLPVRTSAMDLLTDFRTDYPHWAQGAELTASVSALPASEEWGTAQWGLQDAVYRILVGESGDIAPILEQLDELILELAGGTP